MAANQEQERLAAAAALAVAAKSATLATLSPNASCNRFTKIEIRPTMLTRPATMPIVRSGAFLGIGTRHALALDVINALLNDRPVVSMPSRPSPVASHRVASG